MSLIPLLVILAISGSVFDVLLKRTRKSVAALTAINATGGLGLTWAILSTLYWDGFMIVEITICVVLIAILAALVWGAFSFERTGRTGVALALLAVGAGPVVLTYGLLFYIEANPIDWK